jgi:Ubiquitin fold domain
MTLKAVVESVAKKDIPPEQKYLVFEMIITDPDTDDEIEVPYLRLQLK